MGIATLSRVSSDEYKGMCNTHEGFGFLLFPWSELTEER